MNRDGFNEAHEHIIHAADYLTQSVNDAADRCDRAASAGAALAAEVYCYMQDPETGHTDELGVAYAAFMELHAGNFAARFDA